MRLLGDGAGWGGQACHIPEGRRYGQQGVRLRRGRALYGGWKRGYKAEYG